jgi:exonuclease SbcC
MERIHTTTENERQIKAQLDEIESALTKKNILLNETNDVNNELKIYSDKLNALLEKQKTIKKANHELHNQTDELQNNINLQTEAQKEEAKLLNRETQARTERENIVIKRNKLLDDSGNTNANAKFELAALDKQRAGDELKAKQNRDAVNKNEREFIESSALRNSASANLEGANENLNAAKSSLEKRNSQNWDNTLAAGKLTETRAERTRLVAERDEAVIGFTEIKNNAARLAEAKNRVDKIADRRETLLALANDLSGKNPKKEAFDSWLLAWRLREITAYASRRLTAMSDGQYHILSESNADRGGNALRGLDLAVFDENTGKKRPCATLSGGESFLASISLALGLADALEARGGGVQLDAVFIDEGFGSLDDSALELALGVFDELSSARMVGLVSHVDELKDRIKSQVEIIKTRHGSHILQPER